MDFSQQNNFDREFYAKDFSVVNELLHKIRESFISGKEVLLDELDLDEIFITKKGQAETGIIGVATAKPTTATNELYRTYEVKPCTLHDYYVYIANFTKKYHKHHMNFKALEGEIIFFKD